MQPVPHQQSASSDVIRAFGYLSLVLAIVSAFLITPLAYLSSIAWIQGFVARFYQPGFEDVVSVAWFSLSAAAMFCLFWALISVLLRMIAIWIVSRIL